MLKVKVRKFGNSLGVALPKEVINTPANRRRRLAFSD